MQSKYTFKDLAADVLKSSENPLSIEDIWKIATTEGLTNKLSSLGKTPIKTLAAQIYTDLKKEDSRFIQPSKRPATFQLVSKYDNSSVTTPQLSTTTTKSYKYKERDLHKLLSSFVISSPYFKCQTKTVYHEKSNKTKKGKNEWLHPDIVGVYYPFKEYTNETLSLYSTMTTSPYKLFSFEMKIKIDYQNLREYYFQTVSNSSWAHEGYLVALNLDEDPDFLEELKRLNNSFGIGVIKLNTENITQSEIVLSAKTNSQLDFQTIDRLISENPDFKEFISDISIDTKDNDPRLRGKYDDFFEDDEDAQEYCKKKEIYSNI